MAFITPLGHPVNVLVMSPGGYNFSDFVRVGLPLLDLVRGRDDRPTDFLAALIERCGRLVAANEFSRERSTVRHCTTRPYSMCRYDRHLSDGQFLDPISFHLEPDSRPFRGDDRSVGRDFDGGFDDVFVPVAFAAETSPGIV